MHHSKEVFWWSLFSAGGVMAALFMPALMIATGVILPKSGPAAYAQIHETVSFWPVRILLFVVLFLSFFHCGHRVKHILMDLGLRRASGALAVLSYGAATLGTLAAAYVLATLGSGQ